MRDVGIVDFDAIGRQRCYKPVQPPSPSCPSPMRPASLLQPVSAGLVAAFVGYASSFAVILKGLTAVGASDAQAASGLMALSIAMGFAGIALSLWSRMPISVGLVDAGRGAARLDRRGGRRLSRRGRRLPVSSARCSSRRG